MAMKSLTVGFSKSLQEIVMLSPEEFKTEGLAVNDA